ncbi:MAG TPA: hypothetical protein VFV01_47670 [Spirillospora sp.]|nr:hypothetical protein [Spirillospora sp.]
MATPSSAACGYTSPDGGSVTFQMWAKSSYPDALADLRHQTAVGLREAMLSAGFELTPLVGVDELVAHMEANPAAEADEQGDA